MPIDPNDGPPFLECSGKPEQENGGERWIRTVDSMCWISVIHRLTGFGYMEWETAICFLHDTGDRERTWRDRDCLVIKGDRREELATIPKDQLKQWYDDNINGNRNSMETILEEIRP